MAARDGEQGRATGTVRLPASELEFWRQHSGVDGGSDKVARASAARAASERLLAASSHTAAEVGAMLKLAPSTLRRYKAERKIYAYTAHGRLLFPDWQFDRGQLLPHLGLVLAAMAEDLHPQTIAGFFRFPNRSWFSTVRRWRPSNGSCRAALRRRSSSWPDPSEPRRTSRSGG
ncbi:hypothetical protein [Arthrobacter crystallopoietes]|uniref:Uncharacterized protein n=1 Tax=Crystallibacter crystallopoietes TaxID=37928 RepID=A0A1H0ZFD4_9MICC|nr:hypothetical protein [Arthrobacter crystallopoietes]AUI52005.1 hypothetical protein AC20117_15635 [Arthrobacter crystallopoietes]SDQ26255.1 hypothetical protein SAMN04489742_0329 [Arthrobacter crystallopoietes]